MAIDNIRLYRAAESANLAKDHFLAALSHELRTPLTPALLLSESLLGTFLPLASSRVCGNGSFEAVIHRVTGEGLPPHVEENVRMIRESVELEVQLIDDLLDLTKISRYCHAAVFFFFFFSCVALQAH
jgi:signal transduction histidine kinase